MPLRPQLHHIDATDEAERQKQREASGAGAAIGAGAAGAKEGGTARAIHMTIKSAGAEGDVPVMETIADRLRAVQIEPWMRTNFLNEELDASWAAYGENLFLQPRGGGNAATTASAKGKEKAGNEDASQAANTLRDNVPTLQTSWEEQDMFRAMRGEAFMGPKIELDDDGTGDKDKAEESEPKAETQKKGRPKSTASTRSRKAK